MSEKPAALAESVGDRQTVLLCAGRGGGRMAIPLALVSRLEEFPRSAVERVGLQDVIQYRGEILPLVHVSRALRHAGREERDNGKHARTRHASQTPTSARDEGSIHVVVHAGANRPVGLVVGQILDVIEATITTRSRSSRAGVLFTAVVQDRVTEFLDVEQLIRSADAEG